MDASNSRRDIIKITIFLVLFGKIQQSHFDSESSFFTLEGGLAASGLLGNNLSIDCNV
jgi:hypothetical protein